MLNGLSLDSANSAGKEERAAPPSQGNRPFRAPGVPQFTGSPECPDTSRSKTWSRPGSPRGRSTAGRCRGNPSHRHRNVREWVGPRNPRSRSGRRPGQPRGRWPGERSLGSISRLRHSPRGPARPFPIRSRPGSAPGSPRGRRTGGRIDKKLLFAGSRRPPQLRVRTGLLRSVSLKPGAKASEKPKRKDLGAC